MIFSYTSFVRWVVLPHLPIRLNIEMNSLKNVENMWKIKLFKTPGD